MLLNLTNHPSSEWNSHQKQSAIEQFGSVVDLDFPNVPPDATTDEVLHIAEELYVAIRKLDPKAIHIMGEFTLTYTLVNLLQAVGYPCYASTTQRPDEFKAAPEKVGFPFVSFRKYPYFALLENSNVL